MVRSYESYDLGLTYDKEKKTWYSYKTNDKISEYFNT